MWQFGTSAVYAFVFSLFETNARWKRRQEDLNSFPPEELEDTTGTPSCYVDEDNPAGPEIQEALPEWSNWRGSELSTLETDVYVWRYGLLVVHAGNEAEDYVQLFICHCHMTKLRSVTTSLDELVTLCTLYRQKHV